MAKKRKTDTSKQDSILNDLFVGRDSELATIFDFANARSVTRQVLWLYGPGGIGKSWLLRKSIKKMQEQKIFPVYIQANETLTTIDILIDSGKSLEKQRVKLKKFQKGITEYRRAQIGAKEDESGFAITVKFISKITSLLSIHPGLGSLIALGGELGDSLRKYATQENIDLHRIPERILLALFCEDIQEIKSDKRIVLIIDDYSLVFGDLTWLYELIEGIINSDWRIIVADRNSPPSKWIDIKPFIKILELGVMDKDARPCFEKHYFYYAGEQPDPVIIPASLEFADCLPLALAMAALDIADHGFDMFEAQQRKITKDIKERLLRISNTKEWYPVLNACAVLRHFTQDVLSATIGERETSEIYEKLLSRPFVKPHQRGFALHDVTRKWLCDSLIQNSKNKWNDLNIKAANYYQTSLEKLSITDEQSLDEWVELAIEFVYHSIQVDVVKGLNTFKDVFEYAQVYYPVGKRALLNVIKSDEKFSKTYPQWISYYEIRVNDDPDSQIHELQNLNSDQVLNFYISTSLGIILFGQGQIDQAIEALEKNSYYHNRIAEENLNTPELKMAKASCRYLGIAYRTQGKYDNALHAFSLLGDDPKALSDRARILFFRGNFKKSAELYEKCKEEFEKASYSPGYAMMALRQLGHIFLYKGQEDKAREKFKEAKKLLEDKGFNARSLGSQVGEGGDVFQFKATQFNIDILEEDVSSLEDTINIWEEHESKLAGYMPIISWYEVQLGQLYQKRNEHNKAKKYLFQGMKHAKDHGYKMGKLLASYGFCECFYFSSDYSDLNIEEYEKNIFELAPELERLDILAKLRVLQGGYSLDLFHKSTKHPAQDDILIAGEGKESTYVTADLLKNSEFKNAIAEYVDGIENALRYNHYALDEVVEGIINKCLEMDVVGKTALERILEWWGNGEHKSKSFLELEREKRNREIDDGAKTISAMERLKEAIMTDSRTETKKSS
jgi:tetratricopeptide (TPR) repeat protein